MALDVLLGLQWGDEGKGKIVDYLADQYDIIARFQGGPNAGHTIVIGKDKYVLHTIPSGIFRPQVINIIGNGVVVDPITLSKEMANLRAAGHNLDNLRISNKAHLILPTHRWLDAASEASKGKEKIGSTLKGIGPTYMDKTGRNGIRIGDIYSDEFTQKYNSLKEKHKNLLSLYPDVDFDFNEEEEKWLKSIKIIKEIPVVDSQYFINKALDNGKKVLAEGAQGSMLDIDFGTYPFVTSSNTVSSGVCNGLGVAPKRIGKVIGITKAYCTRVGSGPFPSELFDENGQELAVIGKEFGATTGRPRRCGWIDIPQLKYTIMINGVDELCVTKLDVLNTFDSIKIGASYKIDGKDTDELPYDLNSKGIDINYQEFKGWNSDLETVETIDALPQEASSFIAELESILEVPITFISKGPERKNLLVK